MKHIIYSEGFNTPLGFLTLDSNWLNYDGFLFTLEMGLTEGIPKLYKFVIDSKSLFDTV